MNKYAAFDSSAINYMIKKKDEHLIQRLIQDGYKPLINDKVIEETIINRDKHEEAYKAFNLFKEHDFKLFGFVPNSNEELYKPWDKNRFDNRLKSFDDGLLNTLIQSAKTLLPFQDKIEELRQTELFQYVQQLFFSAFNQGIEDENNDEVSQIKFKELFKKAKVFSQLGWDLKQAGDILFLLVSKQYFNRGKDQDALLWKGVFNEEGKSTDIEYKELLHQAKRSIFPSKIEYPKKNKGGLTYENGETIEISEVIKNDLFLHCVQFSTNEKYDVVDPSSDFSNNLEDLKENYPIYWFGFLQLVLFDHLKKVAGENKNAEAQTIYCLFKIPVNLIEGGLSEEQIKSLKITLCKDKKLYNINISFKNNPLPDLKIGGYILPFVERFYTCDRGQAQILIFLFPEHAHKVKFIPKA